MYLGNNAAIRGCQEYFNRCAAAGSPIGATQTPSSYDNAASFNGSNQFLQTTASNISIASGESFSFAGWFQLTANPSTNRGSLVSMISGTQNVVLYIDTFNQAYSFRCRNSTGPLDLSPAIYTTIPLNTYIFVHGQYDASLQKTAVSINNGSFTYSTATGNPITGVSSFIRLNGDGNLAGASFFPGSMSNWGFWKRALSASEVTALFNNGAGRTYASLDTGLRTNLVSWWALNQNSVTADSAPTGNNLTNSTNAVTAPTLGPVVTAFSDPRQLIIDFAQGIYRLGLWNSLVCWPLRRSQNASTTLTVRSLGGLGTFDGAIAGGLTAANWSPDGFVFNVNNGAINFSTLDFGSSTFIHLTKKSWLTLPSNTDFEMHFQRFVSIPALKSRKYIMMGAPNSGSTQLNEFGASLVDYSSGSFGYSGQVHNNSFLQNQFMLAASQANGNLYSQYRNGIALQSNVTGARNFDTPAGGSDYTTAGGVSNVLAAIASGGVGHNVTSALMCLFNTQLNAVQHSNVNALIKSTVGSGLY